MTNDPTPLASGFKEFLKSRRNTCGVVTYHSPPLPTGLFTDGILRFSAASSWAQVSQGTPCYSIMLHREDHVGLGLKLDHYLRALGAQWRTNWNSLSVDISREFYNIMENFAGEALQPLHSGKGRSSWNPDRHHILVVELKDDIQLEAAILKARGAQYNWRTKYGLRGLLDYTPQAGN